MVAKLPPSAHDRLNRQLELGVENRKSHPLFGRIVDLFFPEPAHCPLCEFPFTREPKGWSRAHLCARCQEGITEIMGGVCRICGRPDAGPICHECQTSEHLFFSARAFGRYLGTVEKAIKAYKYQGKVDLLPILGEWMTEAYLRYYGTERSVVVVPVPMHPVKKTNRGYNQAEELAKYLCKVLKLPYADSLQRTVLGASQTTHNRLDRKFAGQNPFEMITVPVRTRHMLRHHSSHHLSRTSSAINPVAGQTVLLVDDVLTTGSTADACAEVLYRGGAEAVHVLTVAR